MLKQGTTYEDMEAIDPDYYKTLVWMLQNDITGVLDLTFRCPPSPIIKRLPKRLYCCPRMRQPLFGRLFVRPSFI